jgi:hypothetical protein
MINNNINQLSKNTSESEKIGNVDNTILFYIYYSKSSIGSDALIIEKQMEIALLSNLKQINIGLYNILTNNINEINIINNIINNAKQRLILRFKMEKKNIEDLFINLIYFNNNNFTSVLNKLLYETYFFPEKEESKKNIKGRYSFVFLNDGYYASYDKTNISIVKNENYLIQTIKSNLNPNIIFTKISFNENVEKLSSTYIRNIAITNNYDKFDSMMMKLGYSKKNSNEILNVIRNSSNVMTMGDIFNKTTSMISTLGANLSSRFSDMVNTNNTNNTMNTNTANYANNKRNVSYATYGGFNKHKTKKNNIKKRNKTLSKNKIKKLKYSLNIK